MWKGPPSQTQFPGASETQQRVSLGASAPTLRGCWKRKGVPSAGLVPESAACPRCGQTVGPAGRGGPRAAVPPWLSLHLGCDRTRGLSLRRLTVRAGSARAPRGSKGGVRTWSDPGTVATSFLPSRVVQLRSRAPLGLLLSCAARPLRRCESWPARQPHILALWDEHLGYRQDVGLPLW